MTTNQLPVFSIVTNTELAQAKTEGRYPLASITFLKADKPDVNNRMRVYYAEIVSNIEAAWVTKGSPDRDIDQIELEDLKHAAWAGVEVFYQHRNAVMEHGTHILDVDMTKTPERNVGAIAAWSTHPNFSKYAPQEGWVALKARNVGAGNIHYVVGGPLSDGQETKYDYEDMLVSQSANFRLFIPPFLDTPKVFADGTVGGTWIETLLSSLQLPREESIAASKVAATKFAINQDAYEGAKRDVANDRVIPASALCVGDVDGNPLDLAEVTDVRVHVYAKIGGSFTMLRSFTWDHSPFAVALVNKYRQHLFSLKAL
jgi:hypothetical protein